MSVLFLPFDVSTIKRIVNGLCFEPHTSGLVVIPAFFSGTPASIYRLPRDRRADEDTRQSVLARWRRMTESNSLYWVCNPVPLHEDIRRRFGGGGHDPPSPGSEPGTLTNCANPHQKRVRVVGVEPTYTGVSDLPLNRLSSRA